MVFHRRSDKKHLSLQPADRKKVFYHKKEDLDTKRYGAKSKTREDMKPATLISDIVSTYEMSGNGIVLDFCMGQGGSSCIGTLSAGRRFIGAEKDPGRFTNACKRIKVSTQSQQVCIHSRPSLILLSFVCRKGQHRFLLRLRRAPSKRSVLCPHLRPCRLCIARSHL